MTDAVRIAVIKPCCIGDCVMALPALDAILAAYPEQPVDVYVGQHSRAVFEAHASPITILPCPEHVTRDRMMRFAWRLRRGRYDLIVLLDRSRAFHLAAKLGTRGVVAVPAVQHPETRHESEVYCDTVRSVGIRVTEISPALPARKPAHVPGVTFSEPYAVLHAGGGTNPGANMPAKRWPVAYKAELATELTRRELTVVITGGPEDAPDAADIAKMAGGGVIPLAGKVSFAQSMDIVGNARLFVGADTGLTHVAAALGVPTVAIFGPTNPNRYRPLGRAVEVCAAPGSPDVTDRDLRRTAATGATDADVALVTVAHVLGAIDRLIEANP